MEMLQRKVFVIKNSESAKLRALRTLVLYVHRDLRALMLHVPRVLHALVPYMPVALRANVSHMFYVLLYLTYLRQSNDTININDINTLYPLRVATYVKNEFQNLQKRFKSNQIGLSYVQV